MVLGSEQLDLVEAEPVEDAGDGVAGSAADGGGDFILLGEWESLFTIRTAGDSNRARLGSACTCGVSAISLSLRSGEGEFVRLSPPLVTRGGLFTSNIPSVKPSMFASSSESSRLAFLWTVSAVADPNSNTAPRG